MMTVYLWVYTFVLAFIWWFFIIAKIHANQYKNFSPNIVVVTKVLFFFLLALSILWYVLIFFWTNNTTSNVTNYSSIDTWEVSY